MDTRITLAARRTVMIAMLGLAASSTILAVGGADGSPAARVRRHLYPCAMPLPSVAVSLDTAACAGGTIIATATLTDGAAITWSAQGGTVASGQGTQRCVFAVGGGETITVTATVTNGCSASDSKTATILSQPSARITAPTSVQADSTGNAASVPSAGAGATYAWTISNGTITAGQGSPGITFSAGAAGITLVIDVEVTSAAGCSATGSKSIGVGCTPPAITTHPASTTICSGNTATLNVTATGTDPLHYQWYRGSGTGNPVGTDSDSFTTPALTSTTSYWVRVTGACPPAADSNMATVTVNPATAITAWSANPTSIQVGASSALSGTLTGTGLSSTITQTGGTGSGTISPASGTGTNVSSTFTATGAGTVNLRLTATGTCGTLTQDLIITVSSIPTYTLTVSIGTGATGTPATTASYEQGIVVNYSYSAQSCYGNLSVLLDGSPVSASGSVTMNSNHTLAVTATLNTYTVNFNAGTGGTLTGNTSQTINCGGSTSAVTAVPNSGYTFTNWTGTGGFVTTTTNPLTVSNVTSNMTITANFSAIPTYTLTVSIGTGATGTPASTASYTQGTVVNYSYTASTCYGNLSVLLDGSPVSASGSVTMNANHTLAVSATLNTYTITASAGANGSITPSGSVVVNCGSSQNFVFTPNGGYIVSNVLVDGSSVGHPASYNFATVTANHTISVSFVAVLTVSCTATPTSGVAPLDVAFTSTPSGGNPASYAYAWDFGDGGTDTTQNPSHTYTVANSYTATITVSDGIQSAQCSKSITVNANHNPTIDSFTANPNNIITGDISNLTATVGDVDGDTVSWTLSIDPSSTAAGSFTGPTSGTGNISSQVQGTFAGTLIINANASDGHGGTATGVHDTEVGDIGGSRFALCVACSYIACKRRRQCPSQRQLVRCRGPLVPRSAPSGRCDVAC